MKDLSGRLGVSDLRLEHDSSPAVDIPAAYRFNAGVAGIEEADRILIVGSNPRREAPVLNARIRKAYLAKPSLAIGYIGEDDAELTYKTVAMGKRIADADGLSRLQTFFEGSERPMLILGEPALTNPSHRRQLGLLVRALGERLIRAGWNGFCALASTASRTGAHELGWTSSMSADTEPKVVYLLASEAPLEGRPAFVIYQGHHGDAGAQSADLVLPGLAYTEKSALFVNTEGRAQRTTAAVGGPAGARADWQIVRALAEVSGVRLAFDDEAGLYRRIDEIAPGLLEHFGELQESSSMISSTLLPKVLLLGGPDSAGTPLRSRITDYYLTDAISRASPTMAKCSLFFNRPGEL
jgi:NADH dehydrogenase (ubiquinone) Fe-S protein 1